MSTYSDEFTGISNLNVIITTSISVVTEKQGDGPGIQVLAWKTGHSNSLPCHPLLKITATRNCFWHPSTGLSLFLSTSWSNRAAESRLCEIPGGKRRILTHSWQLSFPQERQLRSQKEILGGISPRTHMQDTVCAQAIQLLCGDCCTITAGLLWSNRVVQSLAVDWTVRFAHATCMIDSQNYSRPCWVRRGSRRHQWNQIKNS